MAEKLLFWRNDDEIQGDILDPKEEMERMQQEGASAPADVPEDNAADE